MKSSDNKQADKSRLHESINTLLKAQTDCRQSINKRFDQLDADIKQNSTALDQQLQAGLKESQRLVDSIKEDNGSLGEQINYIEKKIDYVDKTLDLRIKHFDEVLKGGQEQYEKTAKDIESQIRYQGDRLADIETKLSSIKYWYIGVCMIVVGLIWVLISQLSGADKLFMAEMSKSDSKIAYSMQQNFKETLQSLHQDNNALLENIKNDNQRTLAAAKKSYRQQLSVIRQDNKKLLEKQREENQQLMAELQQLTREQLAAIAELLQAAPSFTPAAEPTRNEPLSDTEEAGTEE